MGQTESYERSRGSEDMEVRRKREEGSKVVRSRQGPVATMRLYSQSPSPPPELSQWRQQRERKNEERQEQVEIKVEEDHVVNAKPNNEKQVKTQSDESSNEENEGDDDVMKKNKSIKEG